MNLSKLTSLSIVVSVACSVMSASLSLASVEVAKVNETSITLDQVNQQYTELAKMGVGSMISKKAALDFLIKRELGLQEAKKMKLEQDPLVQERIKTVLFNTLMERKLAADLDRVTLSDSEAKRWYEKNPEIRTSHIFFELSASATKEDEVAAIKKLNEIRADIKAGKMSFAEAAQKNSEDSFATNGGDLGYRTKDQLDSAYYAAALKMGKSGEISSPIRTPFGVHLIRFTAKHAWIETDRSRAKQLIAQEKRQAVVERFLGDLKSKASVSVNSAALK